MTNNNNFLINKLLNTLQDILFTVAHHYNVAINKLEKDAKDKKLDADQIKKIVTVYYEAAKVKN